MCQSLDLFKVYRKLSFLKSSFSYENHCIISCENYLYIVVQLSRQKSKTFFITDYARKSTDYAKGEIFFFASAILWAYQKKEVIGMLERILISLARVSCYSASWICLYEPKVPEELKE